MYLKDQFLSFRHHVPVIFYLLFHVHNLFIVINSSINVIVYYCVGKEFRKVAKSLWNDVKERLCCRRNSWFYIPSTMWYRYCNLSLNNMRMCWVENSIKIIDRKIIKEYWSELKNLMHLLRNEMSRHTGFCLYLQKDLMNTVVFTFHEKLVTVEYYNCHGNCTYQNKRRSTGISIYFSHAAA